MMCVMCGVIIYFWATSRFVLLYAKKTNDSMLLHKAESCKSVYVIVLIFSIWFERREAKEGGQQVGMGSRTEPLDQTDETFF